MKTFSKYDEAAQYAREMATLRQSDYGIAKGTAWERGKFNVFALPRPENRYGHELSCEVIRPNEPKSALNATNLQITQK